MFDDNVFICKEPFACQTRFNCIPEGHITNKSLTADKVTPFSEYFQIVTCAFCSFIV